MIREKPNNVNKHYFQKIENFFLFFFANIFKVQQIGPLNSFLIFGEGNFGSTTVPVHLNNNNKEKKKSIHE